MRGGLVGSICFLAFLLSSGIKGQNLLNSYDLQQGDNTEFKTVDPPIEDLEESRVPSQYTTEDAAVPVDENTKTGQSKSASSESEEKTVGPPDSTESKSEDQDLLRSTNEPESEERFGLISANTFAGSTSRVISPSDYIIPHLILGGENLILCSRENELHNIWSPVYQCLVCVCVRDGWALHAVCVSCNTCLNPPEPKPPIFIIEPPPPPPLPIPLPLPPLLPLPIPLPPLPPQPIPLPPLPPQPIPLPILPLPPLPPQPIPLPPLPPQPIPLPPLPPQPIPLPPFPLPEPLPLPPFPLPEPLPLPPFPLPEPLPLPPFPLPEPLPLPPFPLPEPLPLPPFPLPEPLPLPPFPRPEPLPLPPLPLPEPVPLPLPDSQVSCSPLPTDSLFQNPLNPCQICICTRIYNVLGQTDIQIKCQENPQCAPSPDILPIPPFPEPPQPVPMPQCEGFPPNVPFPHPLDSCKICKCIVEVAYYTPEQRIICIPNPECELNMDSYPITQPEPEPMPWPPVVIPSTPPSPLPGPPPHETCKPYPPNTPFQHPWDECQICMCSEIYGRNVVNIEVNCYTKKSCCIEPPIPEPIVRPLPLPYPTNNIIFIEPRCRYQQPQSLFVADCNVCVCNVIYTYVVAECTPQPNCGSYPFPINGGNADASAQAIANAYSQDYSLYNQPGFDGISDSPYLAQYPYDVGISGNAYTPGSLTNQIAQSEATAISQSGSLYPYPNSYPYSPELSQSSATALANAESLSSQPSYVAGGYPFTGNSLSNAQAQAEAIANTQFDNNAPYSQYPYSLADLSSAQANAEAYANTQYSGFNTYPYPLDGGSLYQYGSYPYSSSQAEASASAESGVPSYGPIQNYLGSNNLISQYGTYGSYPSSVGIGNYYNAEAQAEAIANAQSNSGGISQYNINPLYLEGSQSDSLAQAQAVANSLSGNSYYSGSYGYPYSTNQVNEQVNANAVATANVYSNLYTNDNSLNQLGTLLGDNSAQAQGGSETAQSLGQASAISGRPLIRSGKGLCKYNGDKYHHNCQACFCFQDDTGNLYTLCLGNPCV